jgi:hypothetical protein
MNDEITHPETGEIMNPQGDEPGGMPDAPRPEFLGTALDIALHAIVSELPVWITTDAVADVNEKRKQKYATMKAVMSVVRPVALRHGIRIRQGCDHAWSFDSGSAKGRAVPVFTELRHTATGQFERTTIEIPFTRMDAQAMGSAISYGKRYGLLAALGLTTDEAEDDGASTKRRDITEDNDESQLLWELKAEIRECETLADLSKWQEKLKSGGRLDRLSEPDMALARQAFIDARKALADKADGKALKK